MILEGANGKNPVYHVGKLYNIATEMLDEFPALTDELVSDGTVLS